MSEKGMKTHHPVVVGIDGSKASVEALRRAANISSALGLPLKIVSAWQYPLMFGTYVPDVNWSPRDDAGYMIQAAIDEALDGAPPQGCTRSVPKGNAAKILIDESAHAEMRVLGSRGHGGFAGLLLGSVSAACAERAHCPVLIIHRSAAVDDSAD
jgi:nucleotide-binding universal stress UspA family protein